MRPGNRAGRVARYRREGGMYRTHTVHGRLSSPIAVTHGGMGRLRAGEGLARVERCIRRQTASRESVRIRPRNELRDVGTEGAGGWYGMPRAGSETQPLYVVWASGNGGSGYNKGMRGTGMPGQRRTRARGCRDIGGGGTRKRLAFDTRSGRTHIKTHSHRTPQSPSQRPVLRCPRPLSLPS